MIRTFFILSAFLFVVSTAYGQGTTDTGAGGFGEDSAVDTSTGALGDSEFGDAASDTGITDDSTGIVGDTAAGVGDETGMGDTAQLNEIPFEQKDQFQGAIEDRINRLQTELAQIRSANRSNWASVRDQAIDALEGNQASQFDAGSDSISTEEGMGGTFESAPSDDSGNRAGAATNFEAGTDS